MTSPESSSELNDDDGFFSDFNWDNLDYLEKHHSLPPRSTPIKKKKPFKCKLCDLSYTLQSTLKRHISAKHMKIKHTCDVCLRSFEFANNLCRHRKIHEGVQRDEEEYAQAGPSNKRFRVAPASKNAPPGLSNKRFRVAPPASHNSHQSDASEFARPGPSHQSDPPCDRTKSIFKGRGVQKTWNVNTPDLLQLSTDMKDKIKDSVKYFQQENHTLKFYITVKARFAKEDLIDHETEGVEHYLFGGARILFREEDFTPNYTESWDKIFGEVEKFESNGSGFKLEVIENVQLTLAKYTPIFGSSYMELPHWVKHKLAVINVKNFDDDYCFLYAVLSCLSNQEFRNKDEELRFLRGRLHTLKYDGIEMPMRVDDVDKFERLNKLTINIYSLNKKGGPIRPLKISKAPHEKIVNLLLLIDEDKETGAVNTHYCFIKNLDRLFHDPKTKHTKTFCPFCMYGFLVDHNGVAKRNEHMKHCRVNGGQRVIMPEEGKKEIFYNNYAKEERASVVFYADFEAFNEKQERKKDQKRWKKTRHVASGYTLHIVSDYFESCTFSYAGPNAIVHFLKELKTQRNKYLKLMKERQIGIIMESEDIENFEKATHCYLCKEKFISQKNQDDAEHLVNMSDMLQKIGLKCDRIPTLKVLKKHRINKLLSLHPDKVGDLGLEPTKSFLKEYESLLRYISTHDLHKDDAGGIDDDDEAWLEEELEAISKLGPKVRDHNHYTGKYRGAAHSGCNLRKKLSKQIPVFFHNLSGYDSHFIFQHLSSVEGFPNPTVVGKSLENFISFRIGSLVFKDSMKFLNGSLGKLVQNLRNKKKDRRLSFKHTYGFFKKSYPHLEEKHFDLLTRKGVYPYDYMDSFSRFEETKLPDKEDFRNGITKQDITTKDYDFIQEVWKVFELKNLRDLHNLYMDVDTLLLADVFEHFRNWSLETYQLDPAHFLTAPSLSWMAALKYTGQKLELMDDPDMCLFIDRGLIGGISLIANAYGKAQNMRLKNLKEGDKQSYIMLFDCNNQVGKISKFQIFH